MKLFFCLASLLEKIHEEAIGFCSRKGNPVLVPKEQIGCDIESLFDFVKPFTQLFLRIDHLL